MGAYTLLQDLTVATNSTSVVLNDFGTITKNDFVKVVTTFVNASGTVPFYRLLANSSVSTNYHFQALAAVGSSVSAARANFNRFAIADTGKTNTNITYCKLSENDRFNIFSNTNLTNDSGVDMRFEYNTSSGATFTSGITSLTIESATNGIGTGSRIQIYRLDAEKIADITVTSNTTQVDISNLSIDKDSEYLLVSEWICTNADDLEIYPNDLTTRTAYFSQAISGNASDATAFRVNSPRFSNGSGAGSRCLTYTHIKLSNIGAFTTQSYGMFRHGTTIPAIVNLFTSSTAENITSITKLNIVSKTANQIIAGSRFTLYKLYE